VPLIGGGSSIVQIAAITATNESGCGEARAGADPGQQQAGDHGPIARERLNWSELRATALAIFSRGTRLVITAW